MEISEVFAKLGYLCFSVIEIESPKILQEAVLMLP